MFFMYADESGDCGLINTPTKYFVLTGMVIHELRWRDCLDKITDFRRYIRQKHGLKLREEFHAAMFISHPERDIMRIKRHDRLSMVREYTNFLATISDLNIINIVVDKSTKTQGYDVFTNAWRTLIQRFENTIANHNFPGPQNADDRGFLLCDHTDDKKLQILMRKMHVHNPIPNQKQIGNGYRNLPLRYVVEDTSFRDSGHSYFIQTVDLAAFLLYQHINPNKYIRSKHGQTYFQRIQPVLCTVASPRDPYGIVWL
ncbi:MAG TPA: hypothetical protein DCX22_00030 [Dehalococcoidia bacterium]|nr:hypothetical protein [Dehalococcoidia bacterium]